MNSTTHQILVAGFGGQGILFAGKLLAYAGMLKGKEVSWLPSYGPEMRGGTANCNVIISDEQVASPIILNPSILIAMNLPSLEKFINTVQSGGIVFIDSSLINRTIERGDIKVVAIPATQMANDLNLKDLANMIMLGKVVASSGIMSKEELITAMQKSISGRKSELLEVNEKAINAGYQYE